MEQLLLTHFQRYPLMEPTDAVKLLYQSVFGGGHLIPDPAIALARLEKELAETPVMPGQPLIESIGCGMVRLYLSSPDARRLSPAVINRAFCTSAAHRYRVPGASERFQTALDTLTVVTARGNAPFSAEALAAYLEQYRASGCPAVSHSARYHDAYHPAYRVMEAEAAEALSAGNISKN